MTLSACMVSLAKPRGKPYKLFDHAGLYLYVSDKGSKSWRSRQYKNGRETVVTYGKYPLLSLAEARRAHLEQKAHPASNTKTATFGEVFEKWLTIKLPSIQNEKKPTEPRKLHATPCHPGNRPKIIT